MSAYPVKIFSSGQTGAPVLDNNWGDLTNLLDAVLVNGFNLKAIDSITLLDGVATVTVSSGHGYNLNWAVLISGCDQVEYNGEHRVTSTTTATFTFDVVGSPVTPATTQTTMSAKMAPLGFEIAFTGTNKRAYRSPNVLSSRPFLRVDDSCDPHWTTTYAKFGKVTLAEGMSDIDTFVGNHAPYDPAFPTRNEGGSGSGTSASAGYFKWFYATASAGAAMYTTPPQGARTWVLIGDDRGFFLSIGAYPLSPNVRHLYYFGDFLSYKPGDAYASLLTAAAWDYPAAAVKYEGSGGCFDVMIQTTGRVTLCSYLQVGGPVALSFFTMNPTTSSIASGRNSLVPFPNGPDFSLQLWPVWIAEASTHLRGELPGYFFLPQLRPFQDLTVIENVPNYPGRQFILLNGANESDAENASTRCAIDITGPWR